MEEMELRASQRKDPGLKDLRDVRASLDLDVQRLTPYRFAMVQLANTRMPVKCDTPMFRVVGFAESRGEAKYVEKNIAEYADPSSGAKVNVSTFPVPLGKWVPVMESMEKQLDAGVTEAHGLAVLRAHYDMYAKRSEALRKAVEEKKPAALPEAKDFMLQKPGATEKKEEEVTTDFMQAAEGCLPVNIFPAACHIVGQRYCVVSMLRDVVSERRNCPLLRVYAGFDSEEAATAWVERNLKPVVEDVDIFVSEMYTWKQMQDLNQRSSSTTQHYRNDVMQRVMDDWKTNPEQVEAVQQAYKAAQKE